MALPSLQIKLGIGDEQVSAGDHIAYLWETPSEFAEGVGFLRCGLDAGDHVVIFGHRDANEQVLSTLRDSGVDIDALLTTGRLTIMRGTEDATAMLAGIAQSFRDSVANGAGLIRLLGNLGWGQEGWPNDEEILRFESQVTHAARLFPCLVVCMYDVRRLSGAIMVHGAYEAHPRVVQNRILRENPYHLHSRKPPGDENSQTTGG
ncbi:MAG TPA: MEDS domain-containing protein [Gemmatimonadaceae bacterium]|nr:MEDS domain-containing protein [Gemmatimonadaceae bacterium]